MTSTPTGELQLARVGLFTRIKSNMNPREMHGTKVSSGISEEKNDEEGDIHKGYVNYFKKKTILKTGQLSKGIGEIQLAWASLEGKHPMIYGKEYHQQ